VLITHDLGVWADEVPGFVLAHGDRVTPGDRIFERTVPPSVADGPPVLILPGVASGRQVMQAPARLMF
jgi:hypothetical protein